MLARIDADLNCTYTSDPEVLQRWYPTCLTVGYTTATEPAHQWVGSLGRSKYLDPVYISLVQSGQNATAVSWNNEYAARYTEIAENAILDIIYGAPPTRQNKRVSKR